MPTTIAVQPDGAVTITVGDDYVAAPVIPSPLPVSEAVEPTTPKASNVLDKPSPRPTKSEATSKPTKSARKAKDPTKSAQNKAVFAQIRKLVTEGDWAEAIAVAEQQGWVGEADRLRARAAKASDSPKATKTAKPRKSPKATKTAKSSPEPSVIDADSVGGGVDDSSEGEAFVAMADEVLRSHRGSAMSAVRWAKAKGEPQRITRQVKDVTRLLKAARKAEGLAMDRDDVASYESQHALVVGFADILDRLEDAKAELASA